MLFRALRTSEYDLLKDFLYEAIFIPEGVEPPDRSIIEQPELALYYEDFGTKLMTELLAQLKDAGFAKASLAVQKANAAVRLYEQIGFEVVDENDEEYIMVCRLKKIGRIRTGGQSGVDRAAMDFAREQGIPLCGWCPKNGWAEDYPDPPGVLADYPELTETPSEETQQRTRWNMRDGDAILTIMPKGAGQSPGTMIGLEEGERLGKPMLTVAGPEDMPEIIQWINSLPYGTELCVGGPRASECPDAYDVAKEVLTSIAKAIK